MKQVVLTVFFIFTSAKQGFSQSDVTIIKNVNIFTGVEYIKNTNLVFKDSVIQAIGNNVAIYDDQTIIDGTNKTIIPPLVNAHVHMWQPESLKSALKSGIFVNLDMHNTDQGANYLRSFKDSLNYATFYSSNSAATVEGGHGTQFGFLAPTVNDSVSAKKFVQERIAAGADYIKVIKEPRMNSLTDKQSLEIIQEAHKNNVLAVGHSHKINESHILVKQGINGLMHIWYDKTANESLLTSMKKSEIFLVPTLLVTKKVLELARQQGWAQYILSFDEVLNEVSKAHQIGIPILCGTDPPNLGVNYTDDLFEEMLLLSNAGLSNVEILKAASVNVYEAFGIEGHHEIDSGSSASFILVDGNPLERIADIKLDKVVFKFGQRIQ